MSLFREIKLGSVQAAEFAASGPKIASEQDALDIIIGETYGTGIDLIVLPITRLSPEMLDLSTGLLGAAIQKFTNYRKRVCFVGDISKACESQAFRDFVREANRGKSINFATDLEALEGMFS